MKQIVEELQSVISAYKPELQKLNAEQWNFQSSPEKWTRKEILGHLIDSAANNHQRFVRAQYEKNLQFVYAQNTWVSAQNYKSEKHDTLLELWFHYNMHLVNVLKNIPAEMKSNKIDIKKEEPVTLEWVAADYIRHMKHHLEQIVPA